MLTYRSWDLQHNTLRTEKLAVALDPSSTEMRKVGAGGGGVLFRDRGEGAWCYLPAADDLLLSASWRPAGTPHLPSLRDVPGTWAETEFSKNCLCFCTLSLHYSLFLTE